LIRGKERDERKGGRAGRINKGDICVAMTLPLSKQAGKFKIQNKFKNKNLEVRK